MSSGTPYIGSKISLISKMEIRYEGYLYTIDQSDSTVTLAKVVSLGTEDRAPNNPVPPRDEVFEYIVFRGSDIQDLHVCEAPKSNVEDPAILHSGAVQTSNQVRRSHHGPNNNAAVNQGYGPFSGNMAPFYPNVSFSQGVSHDLGHRQKTPPNLPRTPTPEPPKTHSIDDKSHTMHSNQNRSRNNSHSKESRQNKDFYDRKREDLNEKNKNYRDNRDNRENRTQERRDNRDNREKQSRQEPVRRYYSRDDRGYRREDKQEERNRKEDQDRRSGSREERNNRRGAPRSRGSNRGHRGNNRGGNNNRTKFSEDFDFIESNSKFHKDEIEKELLRVLKKVKITEEEVENDNKEVIDEKDQNDLDPLPSPEKFYDRSKSFFDNISCEAMGPKQDDPEVMSRRQERALNVETFGSAANYRGNYRGRGRGRGRGYRGRGGYRGYRGRGSYRGNNHNRNWVDYEFDFEAAGIRNQNRQITTAAGGS